MIHNGPANVPRHRKWNGGRPTGSYPADPFKGESVIRGVRHYRLVTVVCREAGAGAGDGRRRDDHECRILSEITHSFCRTLKASWVTAT